MNTEILDAHNAKKSSTERSYHIYGTFLPPAHHRQTQLLLLPELRQRCAHRRNRTCSNKIRRPNLHTRLALLVLVPKWCPYSLRTNENFTKTSFLQPLYSTKAYLYKFEALFPKWSITHFTYLATVIFNRICKTVLFDETLSMSQQRLNFFL